MTTSYNPFSLSGKTILITGASSGIGKAVAIECSKAGASLIITGRNEQRLLETLTLLQGDRHEMIVADLSSQEGIDSVISTLPKLDGVCLVAGIEGMGLFLFSKIKEYQRIYQTNLFSPIELLRLIIKKKLFKPGFSAVTISSISAFIPTPANGIYGSGKAALISAMQYAALELAQKDIRVNCISPGMVKTPMTQADEHLITKEQLEQNEKKYPLKRYGCPEDIAYGCIYLLSDAARWITGTNLIIDGGITLVH